VTHASPIDLGRFGVWLGSLALEPWAHERESAREIEALGYGTIWYSESHLTRESMSHGALLLDATTSAVVASGIASIWVRDATSTANAAASLHDAHPDRFMLGLGVSHSPLVAHRGHEYNRPLAAMQAYLDRMDEPGAYGRCEPGRRCIGALGPKMLALAAERTAGAHPYLVTTEQTAWARGILGDGPLLAPEQGFVIETDPASARTSARAFLKTYLRLENYRTSWRRLGFGDEDFGDGGSDRLVDELIPWGNAEQVAGRIAAHFDAGADHVAVQAIGPEPLAQLRALAAVVL
jgi:probable F420-dependent oxidoreductase